MTILLHRSMDGPIYWSTSVHKKTGMASKAQYVCACLVRVDCITSGFDQVAGCNISCGIANYAYFAILCGHGYVFTILVSVSKS